MTQAYYPPQQPMQPAMPQYPAQQQQYIQQPMMPQQNFYPQQPMQPPVQPLVQGTLADFFSQPSTGGGPVFSWKGKPIGTTYGGIVSRAITNADVQQQTMPGSNVPAHYRDGRPKYLMKVPLTVQPTPEFPDGQAQWWVSGSARDELARAMAEVGCDANAVPEAGAAIVITLTGERPSGPGMNPSKTYRIQYRRPQGALPAGVPVHGQALAADIGRQMAQQQPVPTPQPAGPVYTPEAYQAPVSVPAQPVQAMQQPTVAPTPQQVPQPTAQPSAADGLNDAQRKLLESLL